VIVLLCEGGVEHRVFSWLCSIFSENFPLCVWFSNPAALSLVAGLTGELRGNSAQRGFDSGDLAPQQASSKSAANWRMIVMNASPKMRSMLALLAFTDFTLSVTAAAAFITDEQKQILQAAGLDEKMAFPSCDAPPNDPEKRKAYFQRLIDISKPFKNPDVQMPVSPDKQYKLEVRYTDSNVTSIAGCKLRLRSYNGKLVGDTIRAKPGDTLYVKLENNLPTFASHPHPQVPSPSDHHGQFNFNITNLHTHGLHTSPKGIGDNVLLTIAPGESQYYEIHIHEKHPTGTFWYHAHLHGSTAVQVSSGMAGALIIEGRDENSDAKGGLDFVPETRQAEEKLFVLQQIKYGIHGQIETFDPFNGVQLERLITVNGQLIPTLEMRPGEVHRWRFIHAGVLNVFKLALQGHELHEIATDGIALGRMVSWLGTGVAEKAPITLAPGNRVDVLVKASKPGIYYLVNGKAPPIAADQAPAVMAGEPAEISLENMRTAYAIATVGRSKAAELTAHLSSAARTEIQNVIESDAGLNDKVAQILQQLPGNPGIIIARLIVKDEAPVDMKLPTAKDLQDRVPSELGHIADHELTGTPQEVALQVDGRRCKTDGDCSEICDAKYDPTCGTRFMIGYHVFMPDRARQLKLGQAAEWTLRGDINFAHPFHMHVNPFNLTRQEPRNGAMVTDWVWKDVILLDQDPAKPTVARARYTRFTGKFVLHCHLLDHEDKGMMELVEIVD
jgi:FtsP/CotA-like multicopper oxidase with cupredoxin domain